MPTNVNVELQQELMTRLKKIEGQVRGIHKMIADKRRCSDLVTHLSAVKAAVQTSRSLCSGL